MRQASQHCLPTLDRGRVPLHVGLQLSNRSIDSRLPDVDRLTLTMDRTSGSLDAFLVL
ncbi:MAG: hypothetical protein ACE5EL_05795 [Anaerolineae bacterium]